MPNESPNERNVSNKSHGQCTHESNSNDPGSNRGAVSPTSIRSHRQLPSPSRGLETPSTTEETNPMTTKKRNASTAGEEDQELDRTLAYPKHEGEESMASVCICQPDPKIPRPRNAFILYRQHHQAHIVAENPGLANPEISKLIGQQWHNQPPNVKNKWKALAEEEKLRHQQQYPNYRYRPTRNGRRNSLVSDTSSTGLKHKCLKCSGRVVLAPSTPFTTCHSDGTSPSSAYPPTPRSGSIPVSRAFPMIKDLNLHSPTSRRTGRQFSNSSMSPSSHRNQDGCDDYGPLSSPGMKRRPATDHPPSMGHTMPHRYGAGSPDAPVGPSTPFLFSQTPPLHSYTHGAADVRHESIPDLRHVMSPPGLMLPPRRSGTSYPPQDFSQDDRGDIDGSLKLPPLRIGSIGGSPGAAAITGIGKTAEERIMSMDFRHKVKVLGQVAPPAPTEDAPRGPLIAVEGDNVNAAASVAKWLYDELKKTENVTATLIDGPDVSANSDKAPIVQYHLLATEWLTKTDGIVASISYKSTATPSPISTMSHVSSTHKLVQSSCYIDEQDHDVDRSDGECERGQNSSTRHTEDQQQSKVIEEEKTGIDPKPANAELDNTTDSRKPVAIISNFSVHTSNVFACRIVTGPHDLYSPSDHWQWTATQWRGVVGPDLTIFVRDVMTGETDNPALEISAEYNLFVVKRAKNEGREDGPMLEPSALRRVGFEVSEWLRAFGDEKRRRA